MSDTTLKNPLDAMHSVADIAQSAIAADKGNAAKPNARPFVQQFAECETHGQYPMNMQDERGGERWYPTGCSICRKQKALPVCWLPATSQSGSWIATSETTSSVTDEQQRVLRRCEVCP